MSQRNSGHARVPLDLYQTREAHPVIALNEFLPLRGRKVWECAAGEGAMVKTLQSLGAYVAATDIADHGIPITTFRGVWDFTQAGRCHLVERFDYLITNPPYGVQGSLAVAFIERGLEHIERSLGTIAMLLPVDFDSAKNRAHVFRDCPAFAGKIVLHKRIRWFDPPPPAPGEKKRNLGPSQNHAWFVWAAPRLRVFPSIGARLLYAPATLPTTERNAA